MRRLFLTWLGLLLVWGGPATAQNNPENRIVEGADGVPLVVQSWGNPEGIPVVLIHGFSFGAVSFKNQIGDIGKDLYLIAPDLRGHGLSAKPWQPEAYAGTEVWADDIAAIVEAFQIERPILVGWSFGGFVALNYLRHCGVDCASGLILAGSLAGLVPQPPPPDPAALGLPPMRGNSRVDEYHALFLNAEWLARVMTYKAPSDHDALQKQMTVVMMPPLVRRAMMGLSLDNKDLASALDLPVLFLHGDKDGSVPTASVAQAVDALPRATSVAFEDVGHSPFAEAPAVFNAQLLAFARTNWTTHVSD